MYPITFRDILCTLGAGVHVIIDYWSSKSSVDVDVPFPDHIVSSTCIDFYVNEDSMKFPAWILNSYIQYIQVDPDRSLRIYLYGIK